MVECLPATRLPVPGVGRRVVFAQTRRAGIPTVISWLFIEGPHSKLRGIFDRKEVSHFQIRSLTPQQAAGNALAFAVQI